MPLDYFVWAAISDNKTIIIDTGFNDTEAKKRGRILQRSVTEGLSMIGITASNVSDVIVTHLHYDHIGGHTEFPLAKFHLQECEMRFATGPYMCTHTMSHSYTPEHIMSMVKNVFEGVLFLFRQ